MAQATRKSHLFARALAASVAATALLCVHAPAPAHAKVGVAAAVNVDAKGRPPGGAPRVISLGQTVIFNEEITTDGAGLVQILLLDGTTFTVGPNSQLRIDEFVYNPDTGDAKVVASVAKGAFRFIGGQTSRKPGGATINTPVGTIGIRGAMVEGRVDSPQSALFSMIFGDEVLFTGPNGTTSRIYEAGYTMTVQGSGGGGVDTNVRRRTQSDAATFQTALAGSSGQSGGSSNQPTNGTVQNSPITQVNSNLPNVAPIPTSRSLAVQATGVDQVEEKVAQIDNVTQGELRESATQQSDNQGSPPPPPPTPVTTKARALIAPDAFVPLDGPAIPRPGPRGLVGSTTASDQTITFAKTNGRLVATDRAINLPDVTGTQGDGGLEKIAVTDGSFGSETLSGYAYAGRGDFAVYFLGFDGRTSEPFYLIHGTETDLQAVTASQSLADIRRYRLTPDPIQNSVAPFFNTGLYGTPGNFNGTDFIVVEPNQSASREFETFLSWISIDGTGTDQRSAIFLTTYADYLDANGRNVLGGPRRGSMRITSTSGPLNMRGDIETLAGANGGHFFGSNAEHFVIGSALNPADAFFDSPLGPVFTGNSNGGYVGDGAFGTHHVAELVSETPQSAVGRTTRVMTGFMTGVGESSASPNVPYALSGAGPNFFMSLDASNNSLFAIGLVGDVFEDNDVVEGYQIAFGGGLGASGGSTFVDDNIFGAMHNASSENTRLMTDGGQDLAHTSASSPGSYLVSGRAAPIAGYQHCVTCTFIDWGYWGTQIVVEANGTSELPSTRRDFVHLGTFVAGDLTTYADMPTNVRATYDGTLLGTVARAVPGGVAQYVASGNFAMSYDFLLRSGSITSAQFDGISLAGGVIQGLDSYNSLLSGTWTVADGTYEINMRATFVDNGDDHAAGVIGEFGISGTGYGAIGTLVGRRTGQVEVLAARALTAPEVFQAFDSSFGVTNAGDRGLVGSTTASDRLVSLSRQNGRLVDANGQVNLPDLTGSQGDGQLAAISVTDGIADGTAVSGTGYAGAGDFATYMLGFGSDQTNPYFLITGTPTPDPVLSGLNSGTNIREYSLTRDPIQQSPVPFFVDDLYGPLSNFNSSNLFIVESNTSTTGSPNLDARVFQSWVSIEGSGVTQRSAAMVVAASVVEENTEHLIYTGRRGSFRHDPYDGPTNMRGGLGTIAGPSGNHFFGANANSFVLGAPLDPVDSFSDSHLGTGFTGNQQDGYIGGGYPFSTHHVADLAQTIPQASVTRTSRNVNGYMTGLIESSIEGPNNPFFVQSGDLPTLSLGLDAVHNSVVATAEVSDSFQLDIEGTPLVINGNPIVDHYELAFGQAGSDGGGSAFVDDDRYGARTNPNVENTRLITQNEGNFANRAGDYPGSYILSGNANPISGYGHCSACDFLEWGWWGTRVRVDDADVGGNRADFVHMGTWVAGDITDTIDLPTNIEATYEGTALGNVARQTSDGMARYIARGDMNMDFDFSTRSGTVEISNFDGLNLISEVNSVNGSQQALFQGDIIGNDIDHGIMNGAFVNNGLVPAGGVIGNFTVVGTGLTATGTIAGIKTGETPVLPGL